MRAWSPAASLCSVVCRRDSGTRSFGRGTREDRGMNRTVETDVLALQSFHIAFLLLRDSIPLGSLNDVQVVRAIRSRALFRKTHTFLNLNRRVQLKRMRNLENGDESPLRLRSYQYVLPGDDPVLGVFSEP